SKRSNSKNRKPGHARDENGFDQNDWQWNWHSLAGSRQIEADGKQRRRAHRDGDVGEHGRTETIHNDEDGYECSRRGELMMAHPHGRITHARWNVTQNSF